MIITKEPSRTYFTVQALRVIAALLVVVHHATSSWRDRIILDPGRPIWANSQTGVDVFFIISGFVMMVSLPGLAGRADKAWVFLRRRLIRIVPLYWLLTTLKLLRLKGSPGSAHETTGSVWHVVASYLFIPASDASGAAIPLISAGWTLNFEMFFYLLFTLALLLDFAPLFFLAPVLLVVAVVGFPTHPAWPVFTQVISPLVLEFLFGMLLGHFTLKRRFLHPVAGGLLLLAGAGVLLTIPLPYERLRAFYWGLPALAIVAGAVALEDWIGCGLPKWLLEAGNASYAIYLVHGFVLSPIWIVLVRLGRTGTIAWVEMVGLGLVLSLLAGEVIHRLIEVPLMNLFRRKPVRGVSVLPA